MGYMDYLRQRGYEPTIPMGSKIAEWLLWYRALHGFYSSVEQDTDGRTYTVERLSMSPARMVCQEWASLLLNERTSIAVDDQAANQFLNGDGQTSGYLGRSRLLTYGQGLVERAFAVGTGAWALRLENVGVTGDGRIAPNPAARIVAQRFDAQSDGIIPLTYDEDSCTECAFVSRVVIRGAALDQLQMHLLYGGIYAIETAFFDDEGKQVFPDGLAARVVTGSTVPLFALVRPGIENTYWRYSPFGVSVFDDAIGAVKLTDTSFDNLWRDIYLGQKMLFLDERLLDKDKSGHTRVPRAKDQQFFRKAESDSAGGSVKDMVGEYNPELRVDDNRKALSTALEVLGMRTGLGGDYFQLDDQGGGIKTATEVVSEHSDLFRNLRKHENVLEPALQTITRGILALARTVRGISLPEDPGEIRVNFDDSIIEDTDAQRKRDLADVAAMIMPLWEYRAKWYSEDETKAKAAIATAMGEGGTTLPGDAALGRLGSSLQ